MIQEYLNILSEFGLESCITKPTREKNCIDHIFIKTNVRKLLPLIFYSKITDHCPVYLQFSIAVSNESFKVTNNLKKIKLYKYVNFTNLNSKLNEITWDFNLLNSKDVDISLEYFLNVLQENIEFCTVVKKKIIKQVKRKPWVTTGLMNSIDTRNRLYKALKHNPNNVEIKAKYLLYKKLVPILIKKLKNNYYDNKILDSKNNVKQLWNTTNEFLNIKRINNNEIKLNINNNHTDIDKANYFNNYFVNVGSNLANLISTNEETQRQMLSKIPYNAHNFFLRPIDEVEILDTISNLDNKNSCGPDNIPNLTLKKIRHNIVTPLTTIFNNVLSEGKFPVDFKKALVVPLYKSGDTNNISNYRPISLTSSLAKILEKLIKSRLINFIKKHKLLSTAQFGFVEGKSTSDAIAELLNNVYSAVDNSLPNVSIFLDLKKAFDTVNHKLLLKKLELMGIRGITLELFKSYIEGRSQKTIVNNCSSDEKIVKCGIAQGTSLGPILFILYINDIFNLSLHGKLISFADDTVLFLEATSWSIVETLATDDMKNIKIWLDNNLLSINVEKTKFMTFTSSNNPTFDTLKIHKATCINHTCTCQQRINKAKIIKYLGLTIDQHLRWDYHIQVICNKLRQFLFIFKKIKNIMSPNKLKIIYYALVQSAISYGLIGWGGASKLYMNKLIILQKRILKIIFNKKISYSSTLLFKNFEIKQIAQIYCYSILLYLNKNFNILNYPKHIYNTRQKSKATLAKANKTIGQKYFLSYAPKIYNKFQDFIIGNGLSLHCLNFKSRAKQFTSYLEKDLLCDIFGYI